MSLLDDGRGSGSSMFLFVWSGYAAMRTLLWAGKVVSSKISCEMTYESVVMYGLCVFIRYVDYVRVGKQSIERDRLIGIGLVMDLVKFLLFTFGGKEMTFVVLAFLR
ncbi:hypothetical protein Tco_0930461 [Tanacetum coccineum]